MTEPTHPIAGGDMTTPKSNTPSRNTSPPSGTSLRPSSKTSSRASRTRLCGHRRSLQGGRESAIRFPTGRFFCAVDGGPTAPNQPFNFQFAESGRHRAA